VIGGVGGDEIVRVGDWWSGWRSDERSEKKSDKRYKERREGEKRREEGGRSKEATVQCYVDGNESGVVRVSEIR
jgi:hypothetical protein